MDDHDDHHEPLSEAAEDDERRAVSRRRFTLAEAIGRLGGGLMKGASPVTRKRQAELAVEQALERRLADPEGALSVVLLRRVKESESLLSVGYDQPLAALARLVEQLLGSEELLRGFVRQVDAEWGRMYLERPHFEQPGRAPDHDDPYTFASVRDALSRLLAELETQRNPAG